MRILLLSNLYWPYILGGAEIVAGDFAVALEGLGHEVMVLTSSYGLPKAQRDGRIWRALHYTPPAHFDRHRPAWQQLKLLSDYYQYFHNPANGQELQRVIAETKPDVLYIWEITGLGVNTILTALGKLVIPIVFHLESYWLQYARSAETEQSCLRTPRLKKLLIGSVPSLTYTSLIAASEAVKQAYVEAGCPPERIEVIYNGIDSRFVNIPKSKKAGASSGAKGRRLIYVGRLCIEKGVLVIFKALNILFNEQGKQDLHLSIFGDGDEGYIRELQAYTRDKNLTQFVTFHGKVPQDELIENYDNSEILLVPSLWKEPFGLVVAEAMARGLPVIASKLGGPAEIITTRVDGLLIEPGNERALVSAILQLVEDPAKRKQLALAARATLQERFLITENTKRVEQHLSRVFQRTDSH